jgi:hypothetical protein
MFRVYVLVFGGVLMCHMASAFANPFNMPYECIECIQRSQQIEFSFQFVPVRQNPTMKVTTQEGETGHYDVS